MNVVVDDRDAVVQYTPAWRTTGLGRAIEFDSTTSNPGSPGDAAEFSFSGTSVAVFATLGPGSGSTMSFSIDNGAPRVFSTTAGTIASHHQPIFTSDTLPHGTHTLSLVAGGSSINQIFLDYFLVQTTAVAGKDIFIDDNDTGELVAMGSGAGVVYSPQGWSLTSSEQHFQSTLHVGDAGAWVAVTFQGTQISLRGPFTSGPSGESVTAFASIDGGTFTSLTPSSGGAQPGNTTLNNVLFTSATLAQGTHTVNFTVDASSTIPLQVDYFLVNAGVELGAGPSGGSAPSSVPPRASGTGKSGPLTSAAAATSSSSRVPDVNKPALIAGVIAGVLFMLLLIFAVLLCKRRREKRARRLSFTTNSSFFPGIATWAAKTVPYTANHHRETSASAAPPYRESMMTVPPGFRMEKQEPDVPASPMASSMLSPPTSPRRQSRYLYYP